MRKINFKRLEVFDLTGKQSVVVDAQEQLANLVYNNGFGVAGHLLAHKIYEGEGDIELSNTEITTLEPVVVHGCSAPAIDAVFKALGLNPCEIVAKYKVQE